MAGRAPMGAKAERVSAAELVTAAILDKLQAGVIPWRRPWRMASNLVSRRPYRGINALLLGDTAFSSPWWVTYKQAGELGGNVKRGERGSRIVFWRVLDSRPADESPGADVLDESADETGRKRPYFVLRYYYVFNTEQCELPEGVVPAAAAHGPAESADVIICRYLADGGPGFELQGGRACYAPKLDLVRVPGPTSFDTAAGYVSTVFHELAHSTGHSKRLARPEVVRYETAGGAAAFGDSDYSREELVAELGAAMLCSAAGVDPDGVALDNSAAYIDGWLKALTADPQAVVTAASRAQRAADFILGADDPSVLPTAGPSLTNFHPAGELSPAVLGVRA